MEEVLQEIGFSKNEAAVYIRLLEIGISSAYKIAKESKMFKANTYDTLKRLSDKGMASKKLVNGKAMYEATDPSFLIDLINRKKEKIDRILPTLRLMQRSVTSEVQFNTYKGTDSFISVLYHFLEYHDSILVYGAPKIAYELMKFRIGNFHNERIKKKIKMYHIYNFEAIDRIKMLNKMSFTSVRILPELYDSQVSTNICGDEVVFVIWKPPIKVIQIKDKDMAEAYKKYFKIIWKNARKAL